MSFEKNNHQACNAEPSTSGLSYQNGSTLRPLAVEFLDENLIGNWVVVLYDDIPFPGIIQDVDSGETEVKVLHRIGENKYFWPLLDDVIWYMFPKMVLGLIPVLQPVTKRHL